MGTLKGFSEFSKNRHTHEIHVSRQKIHELELVFPDTKILEMTKALFTPLVTAFILPASCASEWTVLTSGPPTLIDYDTDLSRLLTCYAPGMTNEIFCPGLMP